MDWMQSKQQNTHYVIQSGYADGWIDTIGKGLNGLSIRPRKERPPKANPRHVNKIISKMCDVGSTPVDIQIEIKNKLCTTYSLLHTHKKANETLWLL